MAVAVSLALAGIQNFLDLELDLEILELSRAP